MIFPFPFLSLQARDKHDFAHYLARFCQAHRFSRLLQRYATGDVCLDTPLSKQSEYLCQCRTEPLVKLLRSPRFVAIDIEKVRVAAVWESIPQVELAQEEDEQHDQRTEGPSLVTIPTRS
jgi:hypothetical protein